MSQQPKRVVLVAVNASRDISRTAFVWALTHVVQPGDSVKLLVIIPANTSNLSLGRHFRFDPRLFVHRLVLYTDLIGKRIWGFPRFNSDCMTNNWRSLSGTISDQKDFITESCNQMLLQLHDIYDPVKIKVKVKVISGSQSGGVAAEARKLLTR